MPYNLAIHPSDERHKSKKNVTRSAVIATAATCHTLQMMINMLSFPATLLPLVCNEGAPTCRLRRPQPQAFVNPSATHPCPSREGKCPVA